MIELATTSLPDIMTGMANCWIGVGRVYSTSLIAFRSGLISLRSSNVLFSLLLLGFDVVSGCGYLAYTTTFSRTMSSILSSVWLSVFDLFLFFILSYSVVCLVSRADPSYTSALNLRYFSVSLGAVLKPLKNEEMLPTGWNYSDSLYIVDN